MKTGDGNVMRVVLHLGAPELDQRLRLALRLRWPDAQILSVDGQDGLIERTTAADVVFLDESSACPADFELVRRVRTVCDSGIVFLACEPTDEQMMDALEAGADDYLSASFSPTQVVARVGALLRRIRRVEGGKDTVVHCGPLNIHPESHEVYVLGRELRLTPTEFNLLYHLAGAQGATMTSKALHKLIWESDEPLYIDTLRKYIQRLRKKLHQLAISDVDIITIRGVGYRLAYRADLKGQEAHLLRPLSL